MTLTSYLILSAILFSTGVLGVLLRRNAIVILMSVELMLNAVNLAMVAFSRFIPGLDGQVIAFLIIAIAAAGRNVEIGRCSHPPEPERNSKDQTTSDAHDSPPKDSDTLPRAR